MPALRKRLTFASTAALALTPTASRILIDDLLPTSKVFEGYIARRPSPEIASFRIVQWVRSGMFCRWSFGLIMLLAI